MKWGKRHFFMKTPIAVFAIVVLACGCAAPARVDKPRDQMTRRERDSTIGANGLPGTGVVKRALLMSDAQAKESAALDSASKKELAG